MKKLHLASAIGCVTALASLPGTAAQLEEEVVVTATRSSFSIDKVPVRVRVITAEDIQRSAARSVEQLLRSEGSLQVRDGIGNGRFVTIAARGMVGGQNTLILVDGRRLNNSDLSEPDLTTINLADVERIEVLEGGAGVLFGDQAVGGVINVITRQGEASGGNLSLGAGSYSARNGQFNYGGTAAQGAVDYRLSGRTETSDGYRDETDIDYRNLRAELGFNYGAEDDKGRVFVEGQDTDNDFLLPGALFGPELVDDRRQVGASYNDYQIDSRFYRVGVDQRIAGFADVLVSYGNRDEDVVIAGQSLSFGTSQTSQHREVETLDPRVVLTIDALRLTVGADIENYDYALAVNSAFGLSTSEHSHDRRSPYLQGIYSVSDDLQLSAGYRYAEVDVKVDGGYFNAEYDDDVSVRQLGIAYRVSDALRLYANRDETFRFPVADENVDFLGNVVALKPQEGVSWQAGGQWQLQSLGLDLVLFDHRIENEIGYDVNRFANVNFDDTRRTGITLDMNWQVRDSLEVRGSITTMDAEFDAGSLEGNRVPGVSEELAKLVVAYTASDALHIQAEAVYAGSVAVDANAAVADISSYSIYNLAATYTLGDWLIKGRINNLFGKLYSEYVSFYGTPAYYPSPEENANISVQYSF